MSGYQNIVGIILVGEIAEYTKEVLKEIAEELGCEVLALEVMLIMYMFFMSSTPSSLVYSCLKEKSARKVFQKFSELKSKSSYRQGATL